MRITSLVLGALMVTSIWGSTYGQAKMTDREFAGLKGSVKSVTSFLNETTPMFTDEYDQYGRLIRTILFLTGSCDVFSYKDGQKTSRTEPCQYDGTTGGFVVREHDPRNQKQEYDSKYEYKYDSAGRIIEAITRSKDGSVNDKYRYRYDDKGNRIEEEAFEGSKVVEREMKIFDLAGTEIESRVVPTKITAHDYVVVYRYSEHKFDKNGNWIERTEGRRSLERKKLAESEKREKRVITYFEPSN